MRVKSLALIGVGALLLSGCMDDHHDRPGHSRPPRPQGECRADRAQYLVGKVAEGGVIERARKATGARTVRMLRPGQPVTMDYRADRLNVEVDSRQFIRSIRCG
ncbi:MAG: I78 family peptidase inhibitor [Sphingomonas sp.]|nr:I78 family peptidase inhibitor [Sphingomonas sp.]MDX3883974.1 I78 family peptidase inhibitor [Sphingomonas sp.]